MSSSLAKEFIKLSGIREATKLEFLNIVDSVKDRSDKNKALVLDPTLVEPLRNTGIVDVAVLKERGVSALFALESEPIVTQTTNIIFIVRANLNVLGDLCNNIEGLNKSDLKNIHVYFVPRKTLAITQVLQAKYSNLFTKHRVITGEFDFDLIPFEDDVLSMEMDTVCNEIMVEGDPTSLNYVAKALMKLQVAHFGLIPHIRAKGRHAAQVARMIRRMGQDIGSDTTTQLTPEIDTVIILDREVDLVTPMMTQLTYEGIIDEVYGIKTGILEPHPDLVDSEGQGLGKIPLNNNDAIFSELRNLNFSGVGQALNARSISIKNMYDKRHNIQQSVSELKDFLLKLPEVQQQHKLAVMHTTIVSALRKETGKSEFHKRIEMEQFIIDGQEEREVFDYIEECICRQEPLKKVLRLLCLVSVCNPSWKQKMYDLFRESLMQSYGIPQVTLLLHNLERGGLLRRGDGKQVFVSLRKSFNLYVSKINESNPDDIAYVYSGYAPLTVRIIEMATKSMNGWRAAEPLLNTIPGDTYSDEQGGEAPGNVRVILIVLIGGITFAEIAAIRFLSSQMAHEGQQTRFVIATTKVINGNSFIESVAPAGVSLS